MVKKKQKQKQKQDIIELGSTGAERIMDNFMDRLVNKKLTKKEKANIEADLKDQANNPYMPCVSCCNECGTRLYKPVREADGITICMGICPICKQEKPIIPASDWEDMMGHTGCWD